MASTLRELLLQSPGYPKNPAIILPDENVTFSYEQLAEDTLGLAKQLSQLGIGHGSKVALVLPNGYPCISLFLAVTWTRAVAAPLNGASTVEEFAFYLQDIAAALVLVPPGPHAARDAAAKLQVPVSDVHFDASARSLSIGAPQPPVKGTSSRELGVAVGSDVALMLHTSGTTSRPKLVPLSHGNLCVSARNTAATYALAPADVSLVVMPLFHVHGLVGAALSTLCSGGVLVVPPRFSASTFWPTVGGQRVTWYTAVPTIHQILLSRADADHAPLQGLRFIRSCSSPLAPATLTALEARFGAPVLEAYGMTEAAHQMASNPLPAHAPHRAGSVGRGTNVDIAILDEHGHALPPGELGEVCVRGGNVTSGYYNNATATAASWTAEGWFRTGDQGKLSADGYLTLTGRLKELINRGGEKIAPAQIDALLLEHPAVAEALCFAVPDPKYGEEIEAAIVTRGPVTEVELSDWLKTRVAAFKVPKRLHFTDHLPRSATGKLQRRIVAAHFAAPAKPPVAPEPSLWLLVSIHAKPDSAKQAEAILTELGRASRAEAGCIQYDVVRDAADPNHFFIVECWRGRAALDFHNATPHLKGAGPQLGAVLAKPIEKQEYSSFSTKVLV